MSRTWTPYKAGLQRGLLETKHTLTSPADLMGMIMPTGIALAVIFFLRGVDLDGAPVSLGAMSLPSLLGMNIVFGGMIGVIGKLVSEREDGTLLRNKAVPGGMTGYLLGSTVSVAMFVVIGVVAVMIPGLLLFDGVAFSTPDAWLTLTWVLLLGLTATMPIGAIFGSLIENPRAIGLIMMPIMGLVGISGIFYPITGLPEWVQWIAQIFPMYWLGLGMRSALLPDAAAAIEIAGSWRTVETFLALALWSVIGLVFAPRILRTMARRESGSAVADRRERAISQR